jgi:hypothetical protein
MGGYREWCVPASLINEHAKVRLVDEVKEQAIRDEAYGPGPRDWPAACPSCGGSFHLVESPGFRDGVEVGQCQGCGSKRVRFKN